MLSGVLSFVFIILLVSLFIKMKKIINFIIIGEAILLKIIFFLMVGMGSNFYVILIGLLMGVCEASIGLSLVVVLLRKKIFYMKKIF